MFGILSRKLCTRCGEWKKRDEFCKNPGGKGGLSTWCKSCKKAYDREYQSKRVEERREANIKWMKSHKDQIREARRKAYKENPNVFREKTRNWYALHPDEMAKRTRRWRSANPDKGAEYHSNRRAREKGNGGKVTAKEWRDLCERYGNKCLGCGRTGVKLHLDHVVPLVLGGRNVIDNVQPLCKSCNSKKGAKHIDYRPLYR
jgi:5-methylcytosine-specific restriction endonuclease McrA